VGDLVTVNPAKAGLYLIIDEDPSRENVVPNPTGIVLGKLYMLHGPETTQAIEMHEKWIEVINESR
jgi:hypothetical protein